MTMIRTKLIVAVLCGLSAFAAQNHATAGDGAGNKPNIVLILSDGMGYADIAAHGCRDIPTPKIDRLATGGVRFTEAYANGSFCTPTRAALMSCRYQQRSGNEDLDGVTGPLPLGIRTLSDRLRAAGYTTGMVGKWHLGGKGGYTPLDRGFDEFFGFLGGGHYYLPNPKGKGSYYAPIFRNRQPLNEQRYLTDAFTVAELRSRFLDHHEHVLRSSLATVRRYRAATQRLEDFVHRAGRSTGAHEVRPDRFVRYLRSIKVAPNGRGL
jgi:arylsulfatase A-like enzyme